MTIIKRYIILLLAGVLLLPQFGVFAQTPLICDPLPTDPDLILECNFYDNQPPTRTYEPGEDPSNPISFPFTATWGIDAAYSSTLDQVLVVSYHVSGGRSRIMGIMADPRTLQPIGQPFQIDQNPGTFVGSPRVVYNPTQNNFFVVWEDARPTANSRAAYGRIISGAGMPEGNEIAIGTSVAFLTDLSYDSVNGRYVVTRDLEQVTLVPVTVGGQVQPSISIAPGFHSNSTVNSGLNEYWVVYGTGVAGADTANEDIRIMVQRVNAQTGADVGAPIQVNQTRVGRNAFSYPEIEYDDANQVTVVVWMERGRDGIAGYWGRSIDNNGVLGAEFPILTPSTTQTSEGYGDGILKYNSDTDSFMLAAGDWDGGGMLAEFEYTGLVYSQEQVIATPPSGSGAQGTFNISLATTRYGAVTVASRNLGQAVGTSPRSINAPGPVVAPIPTFPDPSGPTDITALPTLINQIYVWALGISVLLALLMIVLGGYYYMTSGGNAEQASKGKEFITSALIGLVIIFTSYLLLNQINPDLVNFNLDSIRGLNP